MVSIYSVLALMATLIVTTESSSSCDSSALNTTVGSYTTSSVMTVNEVATLNKRGICDVARANRMSDPTIPFATDTEVIIPAQVCDPDDTSCFTIVNTDTTNFCLMGGPHLYYTQRNDTYRTIALERFNITLTSVLTSLSVDESQADVELDAGLFIKIPSCYPSQCTLQPYKFTYGTYKDLADEFGASVGQIIAYNPTYSHSVADEGDGPVLTIPMDCKALADTVRKRTNSLTQTTCWSQWKSWTECTSRFRVSTLTLDGFTFTFTTDTVLSRSSHTTGAVSNRYGDIHDLREFDCCM